MSTNEQPPVVRELGRTEITANESRAGHPEYTAEQMALESELREALRQVVDPEINLDVVSLGLIRDIVFHPDEVEVKMILTTPFCPYAGMLIQQVKDMSRLVTSGPARVTMLDELWSPEMMENADLFEWGLV